MCVKGSQPFRSEEHCDDPFNLYRGSTTVQGLSP